LRRRRAFDAQRGEAGQAPTQLNSKQRRSKVRAEKYFKELDSKKQQHATQQHPAKSGLPTEAASAADGPKRSKQPSTSPTASPATSQAAPTATDDDVLMQDTAQSGHGRGRGDGGRRDGGQRSGSGRGGSRS